MSYIFTLQELKVITTGIDLTPCFVSICIIFAIHDVIVTHILRGKVSFGSETSQ